MGPNDSIPVGILVAVALPLILAGFWGEYYVWPLAAALLFLAGVIVRNREGI